MYPHPPKNPKKTSGISKHYQKFPGKGESLKSDQHTMASNPGPSRSSSSQQRKNLKVKISGNVGTTSNLPSDLKKKDSFSKYTLLPDINGKKEAMLYRENRLASKRTLSKQIKQSCNSQVGIDIEDDVLTNSIKRMRLGSSFTAVEPSLRSHKSPRRTGRSTNNEFSPEDVRLINHGKDNHGNLGGSDSGYYNDEQVNLVIRLPNGTRVEHCFSSQDTLNVVIDFLASKMKTSINLKKYVIFTNEVPKKEVKSRKLTLAALGIKDRTVLVLDTRD